MGLSEELILDTGVKIIETAHFMFANGRPSLPFAKINGRSLQDKLEWVSLCKTKVLVVDLGSR